MANRELMDNQVDPRAQQLFKLLVEQYIADGSPIASKTLATRPEVTVSSATVRNIMGDLEAMGLVKSVPTACWIRAMAVANCPSER